MSSLFLSETHVGLKHFFVHNARYGNSVTFRLGVSLEFLQYLDSHESQRFDFCIECKLTDRTCHLYNHQVKMIIIDKETNILVSDAFLKCFSILCASPVLRDSHHVNFSVIPAISQSGTLQRASLWTGRTIRHRP